MGPLDDRLYLWSDVPTSQLLPIRDHYSEEEVRPSVDAIRLVELTIQVPVRD